MMNQKQPRPHGKKQMKSPTKNSNRAWNQLKIEKQLDKMD
jgi:hypothetical protein